MHAGVRQRVYLVHHQRRYANPLFSWVVVVASRWPSGRRKASEKCQQEKRKTVNGEDILFAMTSLGFENYAEALKIYLSKYREVSFVWPTSLSHLVCHLWQNKYLNNWTDWDETQSARGDNQNRPTSSGGYGGPVGGSSASGNPAATSSSGYAPGQPENANNILSPTYGLDANEHDNAGAHVYSGMVNSGHNGTSGDNY
jgi:nuclear transcription Y subunit beta